MSDHADTNGGINVAIHALPSETFERMWLGFCLGFGMLIGAICRRDQGHGVSAGEVK